MYSSMALSLIIYLRMNRVDLAAKEFKKLREKDEDATLTQMAQAWLNLALVRKLMWLKKYCWNYYIIVMELRNNNKKKQFTI